MKDEHFEELRKGGGVAIPFHYVFTPFIGWKAHPLHRNHRKVLVVDDNVAFCGGMNVSSVRRRFPFSRLPRRCPSSCTPKLNGF
jgi:hypothetical protein